MKGPDDIKMTKKKSSQMVTVKDYLFSSSDATASEDTIANSVGSGYCAVVKEDFPGEVMF